jgi:glycosyltransferase involved in cell wall biosynthesis
MSPDKGVHHAISVARQSGRRLLIAAKMWEANERAYFAQVIEPMLGPDVRFLGQVGGQAKLELLAGAEALLNPICWPEPFGLVMIEALACGTPVLAFPQGSAPEIVDHGRTGFLCPDVSDMADRMADIGEIDRHLCRSTVARRFSSDRFVARHVALYRRLVNEFLCRALAAS